MEIVIRTAEQAVEKNRSAQTAVITILAHSIKNVKQKHAYFLCFLRFLTEIYPRFFVFAFIRQKNHVFCG